PPQIAHVVERMLAKDRNYRFASCAEVKAALAPFYRVYDAPVLSDAPSTASFEPSALGGARHSASGTTILPSTAEQRAPASPPAPSRVPLIAAAMAVLFASALAVGGLLLFLGP